MANTYTQFNIHITFAVKGRDNILTTNFREDLFRYIAGILKNIGHYPLAVNGYKDHVHVFFELSPKNNISDIVREIKANSSRWINDNKFVPGKFSWQEGYAGFSYSRSQRNTVIQYILNQEKKHSTTTFRQEYLKLLNDFEIDFKDEYVFEFYE
jgi:Transposase and inactivated derivatives